MDINALYLIIAVVAGIAAGLSSFLIYKNSLKSKKATMDMERIRLLDEAKREADAIKKRLQLPQRISHIRQKSKPKKR
jgi:hypothetical protein